MPVRVSNSGRDGWTSPIVSATLASLIMRTRGHRCPRGPEKSEGVSRSRDLGAWLGGRLTAGSCCRQGGLISRKAAATGRRHLPGDIPASSGITRDGHLHGKRTLLGIGVDSASRAGSYRLLPVGTERRDHRRLGGTVGPEASRVTSRLNVSSAYDDLYGERGQELSTSQDSFPGDKRGARSDDPTSGDLKEWASPVEGALCRSMGKIFCV